MTEPQERKWYLAARLLTGTITPAEEQEWQTILNADQSFYHQFERLRKHWNDSEKLPYLQINAETDWQAVAGRIRAMPHDRRSISVHAWRYAAAVAMIALASVGVWFMSRSFDGDETRAIIEAPAGARTSITLPDSSHVWLNAGSRIAFDPAFGKNNRDVTLSGEAYFDVRKGKIPFNVHTPVYNITVLGTTFNARAYPDDEVSSATLVHGSLKVSSVNARGNEEELLIRPNERVVVRIDPKSRDNVWMVLEKDIDAAVDADWKDGWLTVRGESLGILARKIERLYNVKIEFENDSVKAYRYSGRIQQFSLEQVMNALALTSPVRFEIHEKVVRLSIDESSRGKYNSIP